MGCAVPVLNDWRPAAKGGGCARKRHIARGIDGLQCAMMDKLMPSVSATELRLGRDTAAQQFREWTARGANTQ
eukprot:1149403-Pelagomonas_calceolata.AAC.9